MRARPKAAWGNWDALIPPDVARRQVAWERARARYRMEALGLGYFEIYRRNYEDRCTLPTKEWQPNAPSPVERWMAQDDEVRILASQGMNRAGSTIAMFDVIRSMTTLSSPLTACPKAPIARDRTPVTKTSRKLARQLRRMADRLERQAIELRDAALRLEG